MLVFGNGFKLTTKGKQMVSSGASYSFSKIVLGAGTYTSAEDATTRTALKAQKQSFDVSDTAIDGSIVTIAGVITNASLAVGYTITEAGVIAKDSTGAEHLFLIGVATLSDPMPAHSDNIPDVICDMKIKYTTSNTSKVSLSVPETAYARAVDLKAVNSKLAQTANNIETNYVKKNEVTTVMRPKGNIAYASLPTNGNTVGDYYYCSDGDGSNPAGNYAWNGSKWYFAGTGDEGYTEIKTNVDTKANQVDVDLIVTFGYDSETEAKVYDETLTGTIIRSNGTIESNSYTTRFKLNKVSNVPIGKYRVKGYAQGNACLYLIKKGSIVIEYKDASTIGSSGTFTVDITINDSNCTLYVGGYDTIATTIELYIKKAILRPNVLDVAFEGQVVKNSPIYSKKITLNGTSITYGTGYSGGYAGLIASKYNMIVDNQAVPGATIADLTNRYPDKHSIALTIGDMAADANYVIFEGAYNDWYLWTKIGVLTETMTSELDKTTFYGALESVCREALLKWKTSKIGFIITHKINDAWRTQQSAGSTTYLTLDGYYQAIRSVCNKYSIPYLDLSRVTHFNTELADYKAYTYNSDGIHPNESGYKLFYVPLITKWMESL